MEPINWPNPDPTTLVDMPAPRLRYKRIRAKRACRPWTDDERLALMYLVEQGTPYVTISEAMGRSVQSIRNQAHDLGLKAKVRSKPGTITLNGRLMR